MLSTQDFARSTLRPGLCLIEPALPPEESEIIYIPDSSKWPQCWGVVLNVEPAKARDGKDIDPGFAVGDKVVFGRTYGAHFDVSDSDTVCIVRNVDVQAVVA